ncbi:hypothetical protein [Modicisalibacter coralii]|uniref:hypothetical protein n=1 Tax=Modicisalibacter coralii TaxID=2304602 RepID=UPI00100BFFD0|nr:hypothetical protein [Halomonas coralii]
MQLHLIDRQTASERGIKHFFTGVPCKHGHIALRYTRCGECLECHAARLKKWRAKNKGHIDAYNARYQAANPDYFRSFHQRCHLKSMASKRRRRRMIENGTLKVSDPVWQAYERERWKHLRQLARQYEEWTGITFEVDHIVPVVDENVCGLHWHGNWQLIPMRLNRRKRGVINHEVAV